MDQNPIVFSPWFRDLHHEYLSFLSKCWQFYVSKYSFLGSNSSHPYLDVLELKIHSDTTPPSFNILEFQRIFFQSADFAFFKKLSGWIAFPESPITFVIHLNDEPKLSANFETYLDNKDFNLRLNEIFQSYVNPISGRSNANENFNHDQNQLNTSTQKDEILIKRKKLSLIQELRTYYNFHLKAHPKISYKIISDSKIINPSNSFKKCIKKDPCLLDPKQTSMKSPQNIHQRNFGKYYTHPAICEYMFKRGGFQSINDLLKQIDENSKKINQIKQNDVKTENFPEIQILNTNLRNLFNFSILDPACGAGIFLTTAFKFLIDVRIKCLNTLLRVPHKNHELFRSNEELLNRWIKAGENDGNWFTFISQNLIYGVDIDPVAVLLSKIFLFLEFYPNSLERHEYVSLDVLFYNIRNGDALLSPIFPIYTTDSSTNEKIMKLQTVFQANSLDFHSFIQDISRKSYRFKLSNWHCKSKREMEKIISSLSKFRNQIQDVTNNLVNQEILSISSKNMEKYENNCLKTTEFHAFDWLLEFPERFFELNGNFKELRGFCLIISNPPWEMHQKNDREFFFHFQPSLRNLDRSSMHRRFKELLLYYPWLQYGYAQFNFNLFVKQQWWIKYFRLQKVQKFNLYKLFFELNTYLLHGLASHSSLFSPTGGISIIVPAGILGEARANDLRRVLIENYHIIRITQLFSNENIFPQIVSGQPLCIIEFNRNSPEPSFDFMGNVRNIEDLDHSNQLIKIPLSFLEKISPLFTNGQDSSIKSYSFPFIDSNKDFRILKSLLKYPKLSSGWDLDAHRELNRTDDLKLNVITSNPTILPVLEGKHLVHYGYSLEHPRYYISDPIHYKDYKPIYQFPRIVWRNVSNINLSRRMFVCLIPKGIPTVNSLNYIVPYTLNPKNKLKKIPLSMDCLKYLTVMLGSIVAEYFIRFFSSNNNLNQYIVLNVPVPAYNPKISIHREIVESFSELSSKFNEWASLMVHLGRKNHEKQQLKKKYWIHLAHLDNLAFRAYDLSWEELSTIQDKLPKIPSEYFRLMRSSN